MTTEQLNDLEMRLAKGWVIRPDQIRALIAIARQQATAADGAKAGDPNLHRPSVAANGGYPTP